MCAPRNVNRRRTRLSAGIQRRLGSLRAGKRPRFIRGLAKREKLATELAHLAKRKPGAPRIVKRVWSNEHVFVRADNALFTGEAAEHMGGNDSHGGGDFAGWKVTGIDFSDEGIRIAREAATKQTLTLDAVNVDINTYDFGTARWDLVTMLYASNNVKWIEKIKPSVKRGGLFVLEYFHRDGSTGDGFATGELAALFKDDFVIVRDEVVDGTPDWAMDHATIVRFVAKKR